MKKGEVWLVDLPAGIGHEQQGVRPVIVLADNNHGITTIIPLTTNSNQLEFDFTCPIEPTKENGLTEQSIALVFQISSISELRFKKKMSWIFLQHKTAIDELITSYLKIKFHQPQENV